MPTDPKTLELIRALFPDEEIKELTHISVGWNSHVYILNGKFTIKIPKTRSAVKGIEKEMALTDAIRSHLPVELPEYISRAEVDGLHGFAYKLIRGGMLTTKPLSSSEIYSDPTGIKEINIYRSVQKQIAGILSSIHGIDPNLVKGILSKYEHETWDEAYRRFGRKWAMTLDRVFHGRELVAARTLLEETINGIAGCNFPERFIHGDFGGWNIIYDKNRYEITGILDWADSRMGDPAVDFSELIYDYGEQYCRELISFYGEGEGAGLMERAKMYLKLEGFRDLHYGIATDSAEFKARGIKNIEKMTRG